MSNVDDEVYVCPCCKESQIALKDIGQWLEYIAEEDDWEKQINDNQYAVACGDEEYYYEKYVGSYPQYLETKVCLECLVGELGDIRASDKEARKHEDLWTVEVNSALEYKDLRESKEMGEQDSYRAELMREGMTKEQADFIIDPAIYEDQCKQQLEDEMR